ncbi:unnamed protein product [Euphydryas editha]|uniref:Uncharacterized protein n=1 Tax=Euphydryas editha TaxID=104508 RepID=A0AAU9UYI8_EUPED|nr:unnamed protein product [Euphydryas editha]
MRWSTFPEILELDPFEWDCDSARDDTDTVARSGTARDDTVGRRGVRAALSSVALRHAELRARPRPPPAPALIRKQHH